MSNGHTSPMCPSYIGQIPKDVGYLYYSLQSDGSCIATYSILPNGKAPQTINGNLVFSDGITIPLITNSYTLTFPLNATKLAQAPKITNTITSIKNTSNNQYPIISTPKSVQSVQSNSNTPQTSTTSQVIPTSNNQYPSASIPKTPTSQASSTSQSSIQNVSMLSRIYDFVSLYRDYFIGFVIVAMVIVVLIGKGKKHE